jgi:hypothetical protein
MKTNGKIAMFSFALVATAMITAILLSKKQKETNYINTYDQFKNRIKEFYSGINLQEAEMAYDALVDGGMNPSDAYKIVGCI